MNTALIHRLAELVVCGIPLLMLAGALLPYGRGYVVANAVLVVLVGIGIGHEALSGPPDVNGMYRMLVQFYGGVLAGWFVLLHGGKALASGVTRYWQRRSRGSMRALGDKVFQGHP